MGAVVIKSQSVCEIPPNFGVSYSTDLFGTNAEPAGNLGELFTAAKQGANLPNVVWFEFVAAA